MSDETPRGPRRIRYKGKHPRRLEEKYKELNPERYPAELEKVMERGQTPARTHRPICVREILQVLAPRPGEQGLDATLGFGGHAREILPLLEPGGRLIGLDVDPLELPRTEARLRALGFGEERLLVRRMNFAGLSSLIPELGRLDFILADLGVSSMQIDDPARGFSYKAEGPLDLRLNPARGRPASELLAGLDEAGLEELLLANSDEPRAARIARALHGRRVETTTRLAELVREAVAGELPDKKHQEKTRQEETRKTLQRVFQALRIAVNDELRVLDRFLEQLPGCLKPGGRVAILAFHSGEDRRVKKSFQAAHREGLYERIAADPLRPSAEEQRSNPRAASAKLRWAVRSL